VEVNYLADLVQQASIELAVSRESNGRTLMDIKALVSQICEQEELIELVVDSSSSWGETAFPAVGAGDLCNISP